MQKVLRAASYSTVSYSAWSEACDPCMFPPEKLSPDSLLEGEYMLDGMFVFFICSVSLHSPFLHPFPSLLAAFYDDSLFSLRFNVWSPSPIYICYFCSAPSASHCALHFLCLSVSALCPVAEESRLGPSSVYVRVALRPAACLTRGLSLPGPATHTSALLLPWLRCNGPAGSRLLARHWKVNSCEGRSSSSSASLYIWIVSTVWSWHLLVLGWFSALLNASYPYSNDLKLKWIQ